MTFMGSGAIAGPVLTAALMTLVGPSGMWIALAGLHGLFAGYIIHRFVKRPRIPLLSRRSSPRFPSAARLGWPTSSTAAGTSPKKTDIHLRHPAIGGAHPKR